MQLKQIFPQSLKIAAATSAIFFGLLLVIGARQVAAVGTFSYPNYNVDITINKDSTVDVTESLTYTFIGLFHGVVRDITLDNPQLSKYCIDSGMTCGGFERLSLIGVYDGNDKLVDPSAYDVGILTNEDTDVKSFEIKWAIWPDGQMFDGSQNFTWKIKYRLYGSLGFIGSNASTIAPYLYWNALPENRGGSVDNTKVTINFPAGVTADEAKLDVFAIQQNYKATVSGNTLTIKAGNLGSSGDFTVQYQMPHGAVDIPAVFSYSSFLPWVGESVTIDGVPLGDISGSLNSFPAGKHHIDFSFAGYTTKSIDVDVKPGESFNVDSTLTPGAFMLLLLVADLILNLIGVVLMPLAVLYVYIKWRNQGRDVNMPATIIPLFSPPEGVRPYLLGAMKDEQVDREDITGSIIDLAYRGYIKIKVLDEGKNYELTRLDGKPKDPGLNEIEQQLLDDLFDGDTVQETKKLGDTFAAKYLKLQTKIYKEMVDRGYFKESPIATRGKYAGCGVVLLVVAVFVIIVTFVVGLGLMGVPGPVLLGLALLILSIALIIVSKYMPAKTAEGSKLLAQILGFRMYMYFAERYRVQGLTPEEFEKYLSYAIVFGIEKEWADKFKDIYKGQPDWYDGDGGFQNAYWYSSFGRSFSDSMNRTVYQPVTTSSASGGGWSGGGGGGFGGGGGGGGGSGAF